MFCLDSPRYGLLTERELVLPENQKAPSSRRLLAVPFVAKDKPSPAAEFAQPDVLIGFTVPLGGEELGRAMYQEKREKSC